jgi:Tfp pilus assembly protein PilN
LGIAAAALLVAAAGANAWGTYRELDAVRAERLEIADRVQPLILARDSLQRLNDRIQAREDLWANTPRWTPVLVELASLLPRDSHLTALFASGDTIELEAAGSRAGEAIQALRAASLFRDVLLQGVVERELENGETVIERFRVSARLAGVPPESPGGLE